MLRFAIFGFLLVLSAQNAVAGDRACIESLQISFEQIDGESVIRECQAAIDSGSGGADVWAAIGRGFAAVGRDREAIDYFRRAAEHGNAVGQSNLGYMYASGLGVPQDVEQAFHWNRLAA